MRPKEGCSKAETDITNFNLYCLLSRHNDYVHKNMSGAYPTYTMSDIIMGRKLQTIDNTVSIYEIMQPSTGERIYDTRDDADEEESDMLETDYRYVLKTLKRGKEEIRDDNYQRNAYLESETRILSNMSHPNIIRLEGTSHEVESFIILERLCDTLAYRIQQWEVEDCKIGVMFRKKKLDKLQEQKLHVAYDITTAIEHLHKHNIVHRDIKPENFQFDDMDTIKLCNFALARDLPLRNGGSSSTRRPGKSFRMTAMVGTPRYMAPEVGLGNKYNTSCDVYSFALTFAYIMSGEKPYENYDTVKLLKHCVWESSYPARPELDKSIISPALHIMLKKAWSRDILNRPKAGELKQFLWNAVKTKPFPKTTREWLATDNDCPCCQRNSNVLVKGEIRIQDSSFEEEIVPFFVPAAPSPSASASPAPPQWWSPYGEEITWS
ncbi:unnamed protein product [Cylindrotheca closterium]|uniref:Protein kinase domain-containing protein n=1 Tax=Cylindrotheca closterium TaxID=2856 RepID=A0AAD2FX26_9STRA|nr:unnamed protein product [Cylindrotheca closterium]